MTFYVGQKVVCINDRNTDAENSVQWLREGNIYTLRWVGPHTLYGETHACVRLVGIHRGVDAWRPHDPNGYDMPFKAARFRPVTDISIFTEILDRVNGDKPRVREPALCR